MSPTTTWDQHAEQSAPTHSFVFKPYPAPVDGHKAAATPVPGSDHGGCRLHVWLPGVVKTGKEIVLVKTGDKVPLAIMIHGGGFCLGSSFHIPFAQVNYFLDRGIAVCSLEYRLMPQARAKEIREDLLDGYKYICHKLNDDLSAEKVFSVPPGLPFSTSDPGSTRSHGIQIDTDRLSCMGWSAGGTSTVWLAHDVLAYNDRAPSSSLPNLKAAIVTYLSSDPMLPHPSGLAPQPMKAFEKLKESEPEEYKAAVRAYDEGVTASYHVTDWFDGDDRVKWFRKMMQQGTLHTYLEGQDPPFSDTHAAVRLVRPDFPPGFVVVATADKLLDPRHSYLMAEAWKARGVECHVAECVGMGHGTAERAIEDEERGKIWWRAALEPGCAFAVEKMRQ